MMLLYQNRKGDMNYTPTASSDVFYQHKHGGIYQVSNFAMHTTSKETLVIYAHIWPYESRLYARPLLEWTVDRFIELTKEQAMAIMLSCSVDEAQQKIAAAKHSNGTKTQ